MLLYGTALNLAAAFATLLLLSAGVPTPIAVAIYVAPVPYNLFLVAAVWKAAGSVQEPYASGARLGALAWAVVALII